MGWAFFQLRSFVEYKAKLAGVPVVLVDPRHTSRTCNVCGHCENANRKNQAEFLCQHCGHSSNADENAARNIRDRAACKPASKLVGVTASPESRRLQATDVYSGVGGLTETSGLSIVD